MSIPEEISNQSLITQVAEFIVKGVFVIVSTLLGLLYKKEQKRVDSIESKINKGLEALNKDITGIKIDLPTNYTTKTDFTKFEERLFDKLDSIETKIDKKVDKV